MNSNINIILNELSLHGQYDDEESFFKNIKLLQSIIDYKKEISDQLINVNIHLKKHNSIFQKALILKSEFADYSQIATLKNRPIMAGLTTILKQYFAITNNDTKIIFSPCSSLIYEKCSLIETFNGNKQDFYIFLSFSKSFYNNSIINIFKDDMSDKRRIFFVNTLDEIKSIIENNFYIKNHINTPTDEQTFLRDKESFSKTQLRNQGRIVYFNKDLDRYYVVDNFHTYGSSEIEIFDNNKQHLGTSINIEDYNLNSLTKEDRSLT